MIRQRQSRLWRLGAFAALSATTLACLDTSVSPSAVVTNPRDVAGLWVIHVSRGNFNDHVQLLSAEPLEDTEWPLTLNAIGLRQWTGIPTTDLASLSARGRVVRNGIEWRLALASGDSVEMTWLVTGDSVRGALRWSDGDTSEVDSLFGVRIATNLIRPIYAAPSPALLPDPTPQVLLRLDDIPAQVPYRGG